MSHSISPIRHAFDGALDLIGIGPRRSPFSPARNPESRLRFARYVSKVQPPADPSPARHPARLLGHGGAVTLGTVRHASFAEAVTGPRRPLFHLFTQPGGIAARRRAMAQQSSTPLRTLFDALRAR